MKKEVRIGIFAVAMICCAWAGTKFFSGIDIFSRNIEYKAVYQQIGGIQTASAIMIKGVKVGTITDIEFDPSVSNDVNLQLTIQRKYKIPVDSKAKIANNGLMGGKIIDITLGESSEYLEKGDYIATIEEADLFASAGSEFENLKAKLDELNNEMTRTLQNINILLESNNENMNGLLSNLNGISSNLNSLLDTRKGDLGRIVGGMADFAETLGDNSQRMDSIMMNMSDISSQLNDSKFAETLTSTLTKIEETVSSLNSEEGSVGKLMNDEMLYDNLASASASLDSLLIDFKENPKRYVHFSLFGSKEK
ncbi:MAG: MlaD family protein [Rikenellaceae bacterium]